jgi:YVTN family beta-propeller protein
MANNVAGVDKVTEASGGVGVIDRPTPAHPSLLPALGATEDLPTRALRAHLRRLPESTPVVETPLIETDTAPGFSAMRRIAVDRGPIAAMSVDPRDGLIYVTNQVDNSVAVLDPATLSVVSTVAGTVEPFAIAAVNGRAFVGTVTMSHDAVTVVDPGTAGESVADYPLALSVRDLTVDPGGRYVFAARSGRDGADVAVVDTTDGRVTTMNLGTRPGAAAQAITVSSDGSRVYVITVDDLGGELVSIDVAARRVVGGLAFPSPLRDVVVSPDGTTVFVATCDLSFGGVVDVVDARHMRVIDSIDIGGLITQIMVSAEGERLYVAGGDRISVICTATHEIVDTVTAVEQPSCIAESADGKRLFIADYDGAVTILKVASSTESLLAKMMTPDVIDIPMLELEAVGA